MRVALDATGKVGSRAARVLLAERSVEALGLIGRRSTSGDSRVSTITNLAGWDVLATDDIDGFGRRYGQASDNGIPIVATGDQVPVPKQPDIPVVVGANRWAGLAAGLAGQECERHGNPLEVVVGWTEPGQPLRRGRPMSFPQPIGTRWAREGRDIWPNAPSGTQFMVAPIESSWAGLVARVTAATPEGIEVRTIGVADDAWYLDGIALAAAVLAIGAADLPIGKHSPTAVASPFMEAAYRAGLEVATLVERT